MQRINLTKYGFVRWPEKDCSDDGNRFTCYRAGKKVRVSKLVSEGCAYLSIESSVGNGTLPYDVYSKLPHYHEATWAYNGVSVACLTDNSLKAFYNACVAYEKEYEEAVFEEKPILIYMINKKEGKLIPENIDFENYQLLEKFKKNTQFIVITHRRGTMEAADTLYGVTMQEKGVSKLISLNIDEVEKEGEKK